MAVVTFFSDSIEADEIFDGPITRSFNRAPSIEDRTWGALDTENGQAFVELDTRAIQIVAAKIVRGIYYLRSGHCLATNAQLSYCCYEPERRPVSIARALAGGDFNSEDAPNFTFRVVESPEADIEQLWELTFFRAFCCAVDICRTAA